MINFPVPTSIGQTYVYGTMTWTWNGVGWIAAVTPVVGYAGSTGYTGSVGYTGSQGVGYTGSTGYTGSASTAPGYTGSIGYTGSTGYTGSASTAPGYAGSVGYTGSKGYTGSAGFNGYTGSQGIQGYTGSSGGGNLNSNNVLFTTNTTSSTSTTTGALQIAGGAGIVGNVYVGGSLNSANVNFGIGNAKITTDPAGTITMTSPVLSGNIVFNSNVGNVLSLLANGASIGSNPSLSNTVYTPGTLPVGYSTSYTTRWYPGRRIAVSSATAYVLASGTQPVQLNILLNDVTVSNISFTGTGPASNTSPWSTTTSNDYIYIVVTNNGLYASDLYVTLTYTTY